VWRWKVGRRRSSRQSRGGTWRVAPVLGKLEAFGGESYCSIQGIKLAEEWWGKSGWRKTDGRPRWLFWERWMAMREVWG